ncbi:MAG: 3-hydroxyacyl-CoA dehydrogenase NAD-binding domain-containing protein [Xanthomonadales bacterium]|nr:3-hydroxyacyl-CoA dehydrogenase NAD-binding domain-containing protein [Xanthomonadales bacterium]
MNSIRYEKQDDGIVHLVFDARGNANTMNAEFHADFAQAAEQLAAEPDLKGVILRSAKSMFFAGGDLDELIRINRDNVDEFFAGLEESKACMRRIETLGKPVVACINGHALGGGWELCLMSHARIAVDSGKIKLGLPEVTLGLLPGAGGVIRMSRLLGLQNAFPYLMEGKQFKPAEGKQLGLIHELVDSDEELVPAAERWIEANPQSEQPWDQRGYKMPGGTPTSPKLAPMLAIAPAMLKQKTGGVMPAPEAIMCAAVEGAQVDFDTATRIESRYFTELAVGQVSKNMIGTFWHQLNEIKKGAGRPDGFAHRKVEKLGILGAGMMGAGIACTSAWRGLQVVLKDVDQERAERGKAYSEKVLAKRVSKGRMSEAQKDEILGRIQPTGSVDDLAGCDLVIEAVFEDRSLKATVTEETEAVLGDDAVFASNTSTLPITGLARASKRPGQFIGLHFFSPAEKMPLVEIICGEETNDQTLARSYDFVLQIGKTPIVVNDSRGFFTSRVFGTFCQEGLAMLGEGVEPATIENAAALAGCPVGPLAVTDEVSMTLVSKIRAQTIKDLEAEGHRYEPAPGDAVVDAMLEAERPGKAAGAGFYEYPEGGKKHLWPGLRERFNSGTADIPLTDVKERLLFIEAVETVRCMDEQVLRAVRDANIGSIFGIGYPPWTGGALQFINQYGLAEFVARADELAERYGDRFRVPQSLRDRAERNRPFSDAEVSA